MTRASRARASRAPRIGAALAALAALVLSTAGVGAAAPSTHLGPGAIAPAAAAIRAGTYDLEIAFGGGVLEGRLVIAVEGDGIGAELFVGEHVSPVKPTSRDGDTLTLESPKGEIAIRYRLRFDGDLVSGSFTYDGNEGNVTGRRRP